MSVSRKRLTGWLLSAFMTASVTGTVHAACGGDCDGSGVVAVNEVVALVNIALGLASPESCPAGDLDQSAEVTVDEILVAVNFLLGECPVAPTPVPSLTPTETSLPAPSATSSATATATPSPTDGSLPIASVVERDGTGVARLLGKTVTTRGVVTVAAGALANSKLKIFLQEGNAGVMLYHQTSASVDAFLPGDELRVTGTVLQKDPTSDSNQVNGTILVDITHGQWELVSRGNPLPQAADVTGALLRERGNELVGRVVRLSAVRKTTGSWPVLGGKSTQVDISDDGGATTWILRLQRPTITLALVDRLQEVGDTGSFTLTGVLVQDDNDGDGSLSGGFEVWLRGAEDVTP